MKSILSFLKTTFIGGALVVLPIWITVLLVLKSLAVLEVFVSPVSALLPRATVQPRLIAGLLLLGGCFLVGLVVKTAIGRWFRRLAERNLLDRAPGYKVLRGLTGRLADSPEARGFESALVEIEDALSPAFIIERHTDGRCTVFVPTAPTPAMGSVFIMRGERVHPVNVPLVSAMACVSKWGAGSGQLLAAMKR